MFIEVWGLISRNGFIMSGFQRECWSDYVKLDHGVLFLVLRSTIPGIETVRVFSSGRCRCAKQRISDTVENFVEKTSPSVRQGTQKPWVFHFGTVKLLFFFLFQSLSTGFASTRGQPLSVALQHVYIVYIDTSVACVRLAIKMMIIIIIKIITRSICLFEVMCTCVFRWATRSGNDN